MKIAQLFARLAHRAVWRPIIGYIAAGWVAIQVVDHFVERLHLPPYLYGATLTLVVVGLVVVSVTALIQADHSTHALGSIASDSDGLTSDSPPVTATPVLQQLFTWRRVRSLGFLALVLWSIGAAAWLILQRPPGQVPPPPATIDTGQDSGLTMFYVLDNSMSFQPRLSSSIQVLLPTAEAVLTRTDRHPQRHVIAAIRQNELGPDELCEVQGGVLDTMRPQVFTDRLTRCTRWLLAARPTGTTDLLTALRFAALAMRRIRPGSRIILMFTDLEQSDFRSVIEPINLSGICLAAVVDTAGSVADLERRIALWNSQLRRWGATPTQFWHRVAFNAEEFLEFLKGCVPAA